MKIKRLEMENFRCYKNMAVNFLDENNNTQNFNVLIGNNGAGKTTIIEGIAKGFIPVLRNLNKNVAIGDDFKDITFNDMFYDETWTKIGIICEHFGKDYSWHNFKRRKANEDIGKLDTQKEVKSILESKQYHNNQDEVPLVIYYSVNRLFEVPKRASKYNSGLQAFHYLDGSLTTKNEFRRFYNWFKIESYNESSNRYSEKEYLSKKLSTVQIAIESVLEGYSKLETKNNPSRMVVTDNRGNEFNVMNFSGGYKAVFSLVSDIASRLALAYPDFINPLEGSAIVLIDELDLHLHPSWQKRIVNDLKRTFPNCQFIISTHSPFIVQSLSKSELINIENRDDAKKEGYYSGYSIEDIEIIMGVKPGTEKYNIFVNDFNEAVERNDKEQALLIYENLKSMISDSDELLTIMKFDLIAMELQHD